jgi:TonB family protein
VFEIRARRSRIDWRQCVIQEFRTRELSEEAMMRLSPAFRSVSGIVNERVSPVLDRLGPRGRRLLAASVVGIIHVALIGVLITNLTPAREALAREVRLVLIGGPVALVSQAAKPIELIDPVRPEAPPPDVQIDGPTTISIVRPLASGSLNVTTPAMAIAEAHAELVLPATAAQFGGETVRLLLSIGTDGSVNDARVVQTSGTRSLDEIAIDWVKAHWRYKPALRDGTAIAESTTAVVVFKAGNG